MEPSVFNYSKPRAFLEDYFSSIKKDHPLFSLRSWSRQMGFKGHTSLVFLLSGQRPIKPMHLDKIVKGLKLEVQEENYFRQLVHFENADSDEKKQYHQNQLDLLSPSKQFSILEIERFRLVADWYHMAILEMTRLKDFEPNAEWIQKKLVFTVPVERINEAINRMFNLKLLKKENFSFIKTNERLTTPKDRASECIREHHKQVLKNGIQAIDEQSVDERFFNSFAVTIDSSKLPAAKELALKFREDLTKLIEKHPGDCTYQFSMQLFRLTNHNSNSKSQENS